MASRVVPGILADDGPFLAQQRVEQARLADVGPADEGDGRRRRVRLGGDGGVPARGLGGVRVQVGARVGAIDRAVIALGVARLRIAHDERLELAGRDLVGPGLRLGLAGLARDLPLALGRQRPDDRVQQVTRAPAVRRGDRIGLLPAEGVELHALELALLVVGLVDGDDDRRLRPTEQLGGLLVRRRSGRSPRRRRRR